MVGSLQLGSSIVLIIPTERKKQRKARQKGSDCWAGLPMSRRAGDATSEWHPMLAVPPLKVLMRNW